MKIKRTSIQYGSSELLTISVNLIREISAFNTYLDPYQVIKTLREGGAVHGSFSKYEIEKQG